MSYFVDDEAEEGSGSETDSYELELSDSDEDEFPRIEVYSIKKKCHIEVFYCGASLNKIAQQYVCKHCKHPRGDTLDFVLNYRRERNGETLRSQDRFCVGCIPRLFQSKQMANTRINSGFRYLVPVFLDSEEVDWAKIEIP